MSEHTSITHYGSEWMQLQSMLEMSYEPGASALYRIIDRALSAVNHDIQTAEPHTKLMYTTVPEETITIDLDPDELTLHDWACDKTKRSAGRLTVAKRPTA